MTYSFPPLTTTPTNQKRKDKSTYSLTINNYRNIYSVLNIIKLEYKIIIYILTQPTENNGQTTTGGDSLVLIPRKRQIIKKLLKWLNKIIIILLLYYNFNCKFNCKFSF